MISQRDTQVAGVIFDLDGTLVDSQLDFNWLRKQVGCPEGMDILTHVHGLDDHAQANAHHIIEQHELDDAQQARWLPGAKVLVERIQSLALPMAIVTRNSPVAAQIKMRNNQIPIEWVITRADAPPKPDPTALLNIANQWQIPPANIMYVGDFKYDLQAANNAGMQGCLYAPDVIPEYADLAHCVFQDLSDLGAHLHKVATN